MSNSTILENFNKKGFFELCFTPRLTYRSIETSSGPVSGFGQEFKPSLFSKEKQFIGLFQKLERLYLCLDGQVFDLTEGRQKFSTKYLGFWRIYFEATDKKGNLFSLTYVGCKSELFAAPMDCNIFQEIIARTSDDDSRLKFINYYSNTKSSD